MSKPINMSKIGLKPREMQVLRAARWALTQVPNGFYLCSPGQNRAAERMIERGFLTKADAQFSPPTPEWWVVVLTPANVKKLKAAEKKAVVAQR